MCKSLDSLLRKKKVKDKGIVVGYDGRHNSERWAELTAAIFLSRGFTVYKFTKLTATPLVVLLVAFIQYFSHIRTAICFIAEGMCIRSDGDCISQP